MVVVCRVSVVSCPTPRNRLLALLSDSLTNHMVPSNHMVLPHNRALTGLLRGGISYSTEGPSSSTVVGTDSHMVGRMALQAMENG